METESPDWLRLQKALSVEADKGFTDLVGNQYRFSEFLCLSFGKTPDALALTERRQWQEIANQFARYPEMTAQQRQHLVAETRRFLHHVQQEELRRTSEPSNPKVKSPRTTPLVQSTSRTQENRSLTLDLPLSKLEEVGVRKSGYLARLGLLTVRDILFYYPRDHVDYARQVNINKLEAGETVTLVGTVKRCNCFTSPRNKKLTIFEVVLQDSTGQIKLNRFFAGTRYGKKAIELYLTRRVL